MVVECLRLVVFVVPFLLDLTKAEQRRSVDIKSFITSGKYDTTWIDWQTIRMTKVSRSQIVISGDITVVRNFGNEQRVDIRAFRKSSVSNSYTTPIYSTNQKVCDYVSTDMLIYPLMLKCSNFTQPDVCPVPKGDYRFSNCGVDVDTIPKGIPIGEYKIIVTFFDGSKDIAGLEGEMELSYE